MIISRIIVLKRRSYFGKVLIIPKHFYRLLQIGKEKCLFKNRFKLALRLTFSLLRKEGI